MQSRDLQISTHLRLSCRLFEHVLNLPMAAFDALSVVTSDLSNVREGQVDLDEVLSPVELPCGRVLHNRLVKAAMYEHLASFHGGPPNATLNALYAVWARGGWGMVITGNVQISQQHLSLGADMVVPQNFSKESLASFKQLARAMKGFEGSGKDDHTNGRSLAIMQLNHAGRQSPNGLGGRWPFIQPPLSASATRVGTRHESSRADGLLTRLANAVLFQTPRAMTDADVKETLESFVRGARLAVESGFDGVQLHGAHGYLIAQFISRKTNVRTDEYASPLALLHEVVRAIRAAVPKNFVVGLKFNTADYTTGGLNEAEGVAHLAEIAQWEWNGAGIDFIEISGGDYESPQFMQDASPRQAFFESFSRVAVNVVEQKLGSLQSSRKASPLIMLTGGLRTRAQFSHVLECKHAHLLGLARLATLQPSLPYMLREYHERTRIAQPYGREELLSVNDGLWSWESQPSPEPRSPTWWPPLVGAGVGMAWYVVAMRRLAMGNNLPYGENWLLIILEMYFGGLWEKWRISAILVIVMVAITLFFAR